MNESEPVRGKNRLRGSESPPDNGSRDAERKYARETAARMLSRRPLSESALFDKLLEKGVAERDAAECVAWLREIGAINDGEYAGMVIRSCTAKGYGRYRIKAELKRRGVPDAIAQEALDSLPDMDEAIERFVLSRLKGQRPDKKQIRKISDALFRKGFSWEDIHSVLRRLNDTEDMDSWE